MTRDPAVVRAIRFALRHPVTMALKARWRDLQMGLMTDRPVNPPLPASVRTVVFVCLGNICRSPFASAFAAQRLAAQGNTTIKAASAGLRTTQAKRSPMEACAAAAAYGIALDTHVPEQLTPHMIEEADMIVVMELAQFTQVRAMYPSHHERVFLLPLWDPQAVGAHAGYNIADPFGQPLGAFRDCYVRIARSVDRLVPLLLSAAQKK